MSLSAAVVTTFPNYAWPIYGKAMLESFTAYWPAEIPILVALDDEMLTQDVDKILRPQDAMSWQWLPEHKEFVERNKDKDHPTDYRKQAVRFCHKVFAIKQALNAIELMPDEKPRYLIWMDADVIATRKVSLEDIRKCLPKEGDAVAYLGRKDWDHSECGWLAFDLEKRGKDLIELVVNQYEHDSIFKKTQWHDSWIWDLVRKDIENVGAGATNLTQDKPGMEIWPHSPMASWSKHYKGPVAKQDLLPIKPTHKMGNLSIQTKNSLPDEKLQHHIMANQAQIENWVKPCLPHNEDIVVVSAGPTLIPEYLEDEIKAGKKIVAVKHALEPLKAAGIKPWACILLDPREHLHKFVENPDKDILWFVASQVDPGVVKQLLDNGCKVWGYHASVRANEEHLTERQSYSIVRGGSATATRGLYLLEMLGFKSFSLYGYDLCFPDKPNLDEKDEMGQPKYFEISLESKSPNYSLKRAFWSKPELIAQFHEMNDIISRMPWDIKAYGHGIIPFIIEGKRISNLREKRKKAILNFKPVSYEELLNGQSRPVDGDVGPTRRRKPAPNRRRKRDSK